MKRLLLRSTLLLMLCLYASHLTAISPGDTTVIVSNNIANVVAGDIFREFEGIAIDQSVQHNDPILANEGAVPDTILDKRAHAHALLEKVLSGQRFLESLDALSEIELPVGVVKSGGALDYSILIDRIQFTKEGATMDVYVSLALPQTGNRIAFHSVVPLSAQGGIAGSAKLFLLGDHQIKFKSTSLVTLH